MQLYWQGTFYVLAAAVLWSTGGLFVKSIHLDPLVINIIRLSIAALILAPFGKWKTLSLNRTLVFYILGYSWLTTSFVTATKLTTAANAIILQYTAPLYVFAYLVWIRKEKFKLPNALPILMIALGIFAFLLEPQQGSNTLGNLIGLSSGIALALMTICLPKLSGCSSYALVSLSNICTVLLLLPLVLYNRLPLLSASHADWLRLLCLGTCQIGFSYVLFVKGVQIVSSIRGAVLALAEAILNPIWVFLFMGERPSNHGLAGGVFVLGAVIADILLKICEEKKLQHKAVETP